MRRAHTRFVAPALSGGVIVALAAAVAASPQEHRHFTFVADGQGPMVFHSSMPDIRALLRPDFVRDDLPLFNGTLELNELQRLVVETLLAAYLEQFDALVREKLPGHGEDQDQVLGGDGAHDEMMGLAIGGPDDIGGIVREALAGDDPGDIDAEGFGGGAGRIAIAITADGGPAPALVLEGEGAAGGDGEAPATGVPAIVAPEGGQVVVAESGSGDGEGPGARVAIAVGAPEGVEIPEELRRKLEEKAAEMAEQLRRRVEDNLAAGLDGLAGEMSPQEHIERQQQRMEELAGQAKAFSQAKGALKQRFISDVQAQLAPDQLEHWPSLDRALVRRKTLPQGRLDGERTDLLRLLDRIGLADAEAEAIAELADAYESDLHQALVARNEFLETANSAIDEAIQAGKTDDAIKFADRAADLRTAVREVNERYAGAIEERLGAPRGPEFRSMANKASYPRVYGRTRAMRTFSEARNLEGLDPGVLAAIDQLETAYLLQLAPVNEQILQAIRTHQPREPRQSLEHLRGMMDGTGGPVTLGPGPGDDPIREAMRKRSQLDEGSMKQLYALLTPEQIEKLPRLPSQRQPASMIILPD